MVNWAFRKLTELGLGADYRYILTVPGRKSGVLRSTPVDVMEQNDSKWLVAGYGPANWVKNAQAAGQVTLRRGRRSQQYAVAEVSAPEAVPVLRQYMEQVRVTHAYFDASPRSSDGDIADELARHAVLRLVPVN